MKTIQSNFLAAKKKYDDGCSPYQEIRDISVYCIEKLIRETFSQNYGATDGKPYIALSTSQGISRPVSTNLYINNANEFISLWEELVGSLAKTGSASISSTDINRTLYTSIMSFSCCYDIWKNSSRKTPGTYFEIILGSIISMLLPQHRRGKFISLDFGEKVATDIVFDDGTVGVVIPAKITTRERIVQPYAHQRILESCFGKDRYKSYLLCVSETQRDDVKGDGRVNNICVPGTIKLFQAHLSKLSGLYYLDPPQRYLEKDIAEHLPVGSIGDLIKHNLFT